MANDAILWQKLEKKKSETTKASETPEKEVKKATRTRKESQPARKRPGKQASSSASKKASTTTGKSPTDPASTLASYHASMVEPIRKTVKRIGKEVSFMRLTPEEKNQLADIVYTYKRQGVKTSENEINRIAVNFLIQDYKERGQESLLVSVIEALQA
ncbi:MAG: hypothetical protein ACE5JU_23975 [Candidatus Binatia bacterium]